MVFEYKTVVYLWVQRQSNDCWLSVWSLTLFFNHEPSTATQTRCYISFYNVEILELLVNYFCQLLSVRCLNSSRYQLVASQELTRLAIHLVPVLRPSLFRYSLLFTLVYHLRHTFRRSSKAYRDRRPNCLIDNSQVGQTSVNQKRSELRITDWQFAVAWLLTIHKRMRFCMVLCRFKFPGHDLPVSYPLV